MTQPVWISERDTVALHDRLLALHGGASGPRDAGILQSALARPRQMYAYGKRPTVVSLAAAYTASIIRNHPFIDGNRRIGFIVGVLFLELNGYRFDATEEGATQAVLGLAAGILVEQDLAAWLGANTRRE